MPIRKKDHVARGSVDHGSTYLHYWFQDAGIPLMTMSAYQDFAQNKIANDLMQQAKIRKTKAMKDFNGSTKEIDQLMDMLLSESKNVIGDNFERPTTSRSISGEKGGISYGELAAKTPEELLAEIDKLANELGDGMQNFISALTKYLEQAYTELLQGENFKEYQGRILAQYIAVKGLPSGSGASAELKQSIIQDLLQHEGMKKIGMPKTNGPLETSLRNLTMLAYALPEVGGMTGSYATSTSRSSGTAEGEGEIMKVLAGKISGMFSNVQGSGAEIAVREAVLQGEGELLEKIKSVNNAIDAAVDVSVVGSDTITNERGYGKQSKVVSKEDVHISASADGVTINYGISVKNYKKPKGGSSYGHVNLVSGTPFYDAALHALNGDAYTIINTAAGHGSGNLSNGIKNDTIAEGWKALVHRVAITNFLDVLAGAGKSAGDNVLLLVVNGNAFTLDEILEHMQLNDNDNSLNMFISASTISRDRLVALNKYIPDDEHNGNQDEVEQRSNASWGAVESALESAKLRVSLNMLASLM